jgi:2-oxo-4-hydroxy-4-carboxy--5-ureidoimidazoline (OHCU) decarboxylase
MAPTLPPIASLPTLPIADQLSAIDTLFEPSPDLHALLRPILSAQTFASYDGLVDVIYGQMCALSAAEEKKDTLFGILGAHPRLGAASPAAQAHLSELSKREQANINAANEQEAADQAARLSSLNTEYEEKYPGLRYVYVTTRWLIHTWCWV